jgi:hypothetical protein
MDFAITISNLDISERIAPRFKRRALAEVASKNHHNMVMATMEPAHPLANPREFYHFDFHFVCTVISMEQVSAYSSHC